VSLSPRTSVAAKVLGGWHPIALYLAGGIIAVLLVLLIELTPEQYGWLAIAGIAVAGLTLVRPVAGLYLLPFAVAFGSLFTLSVHGLNASLTDILVAALAVSAIYRVWRKEVARERSHQVAKLRPSLAQLRRLSIALWKRDRLLVLTVAAFLIYVLVVILSLSVAESKSLAFKEVIKWTEVLAVLILAVSLIPSLRAIWGLAWAMIGAGICQALLGYWQWIQVTGSHSASADSLRVFGTFGQPNPFAGYLNFALLLALAFLLLGRRLQERWLAGAAAVIIAFAAILADSRGAELGLAVAIILPVIVALHRERAAALTLLIGTPLLVIAWFGHIIPSHIRESLLQQVTLGPVNSANFSVQERLAHWAAGLRMFRAHPVLGVGAGNYSAAYARYQVSPDWFEALGHAHNYYINAAAETGSLGLLAILAILGISVFIGWCAAHSFGSARRALPSPSPDASIGWALALGLFAALVAFDVHNLTDDLFVHGMELQFALCTACLLCLLRFHKESSTVEKVHGQ
jgi:O-antigen ligase